MSDNTGFGPGKNKVAVPPSHIILAPMAWFPEARTPWGKIGPVNPSSIPALPDSRLAHKFGSR